MHADEAGLAFEHVRTNVFGKAPEFGGGQSFGKNRLELVVECELVG